MPLAPKCELNSSGWLSLADILASFNAPISEEHAWALSYQCAQCGKSVLRDENTKDDCLLVTEPHHLLLHKDGQVHKDSFLSISLGKNAVDGRGQSRVKSTSEYKMISKLALVIFKALDYGLQEDEERRLSPDLESLLASMSEIGESSDRHETDDEGIERDSGDSDDDKNASRSFNFDSVMSMCARRLSSSGTFCNNNNSSSSNNKSAGTGYQAADAHYKAVCRALVNEALELSMFLQNVSQGSEQIRSASSSVDAFRNSNSLLESDPDLGKLNFRDWVSLWVE